MDRYLRPVLKAAHADLPNYIEKILKEEVAKHESKHARGKVLLLAFDAACGTDWF